MGQRKEKKQFETEHAAKEYADRKKASAIPGYSEVYVTGPFCISGIWMVEYHEYYG
jgi:hypothetical protein